MVQRCPPSRRGAEALGSSRAKAAYAEFMRAHSSYGKVVQFLPTAHLKLEEFKAVYARWAERGDPISLIWTELLARLDVVQGIVFFHASLGLALFTLFPFTYIFNFVALYYSARRRSIRAVA